MATIKFIVYLNYVFLDQHSETSRVQSVYVRHFPTRDEATAYIDANALNIDQAIEWYTLEEEAAAHNLYRIGLIFNQNEKQTKEFINWEAMWSYIHLHPRNTEITGLTVVRITERDV